MMAGNPNYWWSMYPQLSSPSHQLVYGSSSTTDPSLLNSNSYNPDDQNPNQDFPVRSWSQLLLGGLGGGEEDKYGANLFQQQKKLENWELLNLNPPASYNTTTRFPVVDVKQGGSQSNYICQLFSHEENHQESHANNYKPSNWPVIFSPTSCTTSSSLSNNIFNFSGGEVSTMEEVKKKSNHHHHHHHHDHSSECNSTGGVSKKARIQQSSAQQPALKVSKEKVREKITALHQIVSPFGKTDAASVLSEAIGNIRFLQAQIEALSSPYMRHASESTGHHQHSDSVGANYNKELRSLGLCLVPISWCTQLVGINDNGGGGGADYWAPPSSLGGGGGF